MKKLLFIIAFCFSVCAFAEGDGTCSLQQNPDGTYRIVCQGDGVIYDYETITNRVTYQIANCQDLRTELISIYNDIDLFQNEFSSDISLLSQYSDSLGTSIYSMDSSASGYDSVSWAFSDLETQIMDMSWRFDNNNSILPSLSKTINSIACCSDSVSNLDSSTSQCCETDLKPIINQLNKVILNDIYITNSISIIQKSIYEKLGGSSHLGYKYIDSDYGLNPNAGLRFFNWNSSKTPYINLLNLALHSQYNNAFGLASANNYLHKLTFLETPYISTNLETLVNESTNFFSFFRGEVGVKGALEDWDYSQGSYYDYLTNHYLSVIFNPSELSESQLQKTNWFSRIETLLAALVFADSEGTNTVDSSQFSDERERLTSSLGELDYTTKSRLQQFENTSVSLLSSVLRFSAAFSNASLPNRVNLISIGNSDSDMIYFETSEISPFLEACHCVTTLIWCFGGLILLFWFIHFTLKACYNLVVFGWSVVSAVFGK